jgi:murein DD-endopeptidase MepM/ murein hydrolase activator NlpD
MVRMKNIDGLIDGTKLFRLRNWITLCLFAALLPACSTQVPEACPSSTPVGLMEAAEIARNESLPFRFPLDESILDETLYFGWFGVSNECPPDKIDCYHYPVRQFHAAEDYKRPAGTPVFSMADGQISYSGEAGGYGWLILIDHPQANLYSLYGHLSPSRWKLGKGIDVERGELIAYLGDSDENGGSAEQPVETHLHFGIRSGQTGDYPSRGEWRYMAGWIRYCPQDLGWLQPSLVITSQEIPAGGYPQPKVGFLTRWGLELLIIGSYTLGGATMIAIGIRKRLPILVFFPGGLLIVVGVILTNRRILSTYSLLAFGIVLVILGSVIYFRSRKSVPLDGGDLNKEEAEEGERTVL